MPQMETPSLVGEVLGGRYRLIRKLGEGGMGEVYAGEHVHIEKRFAIKLLRPEIVSNKEAVKRFYQEARSSSSINHRNIIAIEDFGELPDGRIYMCMELLDGAALNDLILQPQTVDRLLNILIQTGHGLAAAHAKGIVHRDMKPENIYVTVGPNREDVPKILDFGIAKVSGNDGQNNLTRTGTIFGTPFYMAPEQALGNPVDARTDIYAMGVIMYEVFSGSLPFQGESFMGILTQHITSDPEPVAQRAAKAGRHLPPGLAEIVTCCMQKNPAQRFAKMDDLVNAMIPIYRGIAGPGMSTYMEAFPVSSQLPSPTPPPLTGQVMAAGAPPGTGGYAFPQGGPHTPPGQPTVGSTPAASASGLYSPSGSMVAPKKGKAGLIIAILAVLAVGGGIAAFVILGSDSGSQVASNDPGSNGSNHGTTPGSDHGSAVTTTHKPDAGAQVMGGSNAGSDHNGSSDVGSNAGGSNAGSDVGSNAGSNHGGSNDVIPPPAIDAGVPAAKVVQVPLFASNVSSFEVWEDGKKILDGPDNLEVPEGATRSVVIKAKGFKDKPIVVGTKKMKFALTRIPGPGPGPGSGSNTLPPPGPNCTSSIVDTKSRACVLQYCKGHKDDVRCDAE
jgi:serine/threonine protein kinase